MLEQARHHERVPRDPIQNLKFRRALLAECERSSLARRAVTRACAEDVVFFVNVFGWQVNPDNLGDEIGPFILFPFQERALLDTIQWLLRERMTVVWEKSRKQGGTFLALFLDVWLCGFHPNKRSLVMSHNEAAVEKSGDDDTLFGKIDFILSHTPSWLADFKKLKGVYRFPRRSQIVGSSTTIRTGVGGRTAKNTLDEVSKYQNAEAILSQLKDTGPSLCIGTHYGIGGTFYDLCKRPDGRKVVFHWSMNPLYNRGLYRSDPSLLPHERVVDASNPPPEGYPFVTDGTPHGGPYPGLRSPYYDRLCLDRSPREVAMHWDIDPAGAARQFFDSQLVRSLVLKYARDPSWRGDVLFDPNGRVTGVRPDEQGPLKLWLPLVPGGELSGRWVAPSVYKVGCDVGAGTGATPSCIAAGDAVTGKKVLEYQYALPPQAEPANFARTAMAVCRLLSDPAGNPAQLIWDATGPTGEKFGREVIDSGFRNVWYFRDEFTLNKKVSTNPGWFASPSGKLALLSDYEEALRKGLLLNPSEGALKECLAFEYSKTGGIEHGHSIRTEDPTAGRVNHSDQAIADALMWKLMKEAGGAKAPEERLADAGHQPYTIGWMMQQADREVEDDPYRE